MAGNDQYILENLATTADGVIVVDDGTGSDTLMIANRYDTFTVINLAHALQSGSTLPASASASAPGSDFTLSLVINGVIENAIGGAGSDMVTGNSLANVLAGDFDSPGGSGGDDSLYGVGGNDMLYGVFGDDLLDGGADHDKLFGGSGDDDLLGGTGNDSLSGGIGNDLIEGDGGADRLTGAAGADSFFFGALSDSRGAQRDTITDFSRAQGDKIDIYDIDANRMTETNDAFTFIGSRAFSGKAGQLQAIFADGTVTLSADVNGDKVADFSVTLLNMKANLIASDFIL